MIKLSSLILLCTVLLCKAQPFLVCDPYPSTVDQPTSFTISGLSPSLIVSQAVTNADGSVQLKLDLGPLALANNTYNLSVTATDILNHVSSPSTLTFIVGTPGNPGHIRISPN